MKSSKIDASAVNTRNIKLTDQLAKKKDLIAVLKTRIRDAKESCVCGASSLLEANTPAITSLKVVKMKKKKLLSELATRPVND